MNTPTRTAAAPTAEATAAVVLPGDAARLISTLLLGVLSFQLNASMVTPALPQIAAEFRRGADSTAPVQSMFFLAGAIAGPVIGRWSDFIGRRAELLLVLGIRGAGTILRITAAPTLKLLVTGRFLQGVSSASSRSPTSSSARTRRPPCQARPIPPSPPSTAASGELAASWPRPWASAPSS